MKKIIISKLTIHMYDFCHSLFTSLKFIILTLLRACMGMYGNIWDDIPYEVANKSIGHLHIQKFELDHFHV